MIVCSTPNWMMGSGHVYVWYRLSLMILLPKLVIKQKQSVKYVCVTCISCSNY